jgi:PKD repeat protein
MNKKTFNIMSIRRLLLIVFLMITSIYNSSAQCPSNIGFENGDLFQWQSFISNTAACGGIGCCPINACSFQGSNFVIPGRIEITNSTWGTDPYSGLPCVCPVSAPTINNYSLKLGNDGTGSESERVRIQFPVNTNNSTLIYRYAAVLNNAGHAAADQPRIQFTVFDAGPLSSPYAIPVQVTCPSFNIAAPTSTANMPPNWFQSPNNVAVFCSNWIPVSVNLAALNGHLVVIEFATGDCSFGGHWGYSYIDIPGGCNPFTISTGYCPGQSSATMYGPPGFSNYSWYSLPGFTFLGSTDSIVVIAPTANTAYACVVTPPAGISCNDTLIDTLRVAPLPTAYFNTNQVICANSPTQFIDSSYTNFYPAFITSWTWDFGDPTTGSNNFSTLQNPVHTFSGTGSFTIQLIVTSSIACVSDTALFTLVNVTQTAVYPNAGADQFICLNTSTTLNPTPPPVQTPAYTTSWTTNNGLHFGSNGISDTTILNPIVTPTGNTTYFFTINNPITGCSFVDSVHVNIIGVAPDANIIAVKDTICPGASTQLAVSVVPSSCGLASSTCNGTPFSTQIGAGGTNVSTYPTPFSLSYSDGRTQVLIRSSELAAMGLSAGQIMGLSFNVTNFRFNTASNPAQVSKVMYVNNCKGTGVTGLYDLANA